MAVNENVIKNMATEATRECQFKNMVVEVEFVVYLIEHLLLNPKYGNLFTKTLNRVNLEYFVNEVVDMLTRGDTPLSTLRMQFIMHSNYQKPHMLIDKHINTIDSCMRPLLNEIIEIDFGADEDCEDLLPKLYRKISIYIVLASGLGNPGNIVTLKEGMAALESVFNLDDLRVFVSLSRPEKTARLKQLVAIVSGVRLFNRDCKLTGDGIADLPFNLADASKACLKTLSHSLVGAMQRVNALTTAVADSITIEEETGNVVVDLPAGGELNAAHFVQMFDKLSFNRQFEVYTRRLLADMQAMAEAALRHGERVQAALEALHKAVKYKDAVPVDTVFPLFCNLWEVWRSMQHLMYVVSVVNLLVSTLVAIQEKNRIPPSLMEKMLRGRVVVTDQERISSASVSGAQRLELAALAEYAPPQDQPHHRDKTVQFLGFCAMCLVIGGLVPCNPKIGTLCHHGRRYGFCSYRMALQFSRDPDRYVNSGLEYARNNPHMVELLGIAADLDAVRHVAVLVAKRVPKIKVNEQEVQTDLHPIEHYIDTHYSWDLWEWKRRACQWASIVNCRTHSTQTRHSHLRAEAHCQTVEPRDKALQTKKDTGMNTAVCSFFLWGLRGQRGGGQHAASFVQPHAKPPKKATTVTTCHWPCLEPPKQMSSSSDSLDSLDIRMMSRIFYDPTSAKKEGVIPRAESRMIHRK